MQRVVILGSTGSIGTQTLDVIRQHPADLQVVGLTAHANGDQLKAQASEFGCANIALCDPEAAQRHGVNGGIDALCDLVIRDDVDTVVVSVAGVIGLKPTLAAIRAGKMIALASKEVLVAAGEIVMPLVREMGVTMTPIDSEHSAIYQCLQGHQLEQIDQLILTASGGPFRGWSRADLEKVTVEQALNHPTWAMGGKITIDSATLMNKGLEMIEAHWLFGVPMDRVHVTVHPQSIIHSMVKFTDGSVLGQMGWPNMRLPIQYALLGPERPESGLRDWLPHQSGTLSFEEPDTTVFRMLDLARLADQRGGTAPCAMNAANEEAANAFLRGEIPFLGIERAVEAVLESHAPGAVNLESLLAVDAESRERAREIMSLMKENV